MTTRQAMFPLAIMCASYAAASFASGIAGNQAKAFQNALALNKTQMAVLTVGPAIAYAVTPLTLGWWLTKRYGYRVAIIVGLLLKTVGGMGYWPSAVFRFYPGFCISTFFSGAGAALCHCAVSAYVNLCGPGCHAEIRWLIVSSIGTVFYIIAEVIATFIVYADTAVETGHGSLEAIKWTHVGAACVFLAMAVAFCAVRVPEITDADMEADVKAKASRAGCETLPLRKQTLFWAGTATFVPITTAGLSIGVFFMNIMQVLMPGTSDRTASGLRVVATACAVPTNIAVVFVLKHVRPRLVLTASYLAALLYVVVALASPNRVGAAFLILQHAARAPGSVVLYALALRGLGRHTKRGGALLISVGGGAGGLLAPASGALADRAGMRAVLGLVAGLLGSGIFFLVYVNVWRGKELDELREAEREEAKGDAEKARADVEGGSVTEKKEEAFLEL